MMRVRKVVLPFASLTPRNSFASFKHIRYSLKLLNHPPHHRKKLFRRRIKPFFFFLRGKFQ